MYLAIKGTVSVEGENLESIKKEVRERTPEMVSDFSKELDLLVHLYFGKDVDPNDEKVITFRKKFIEASLENHSSPNNDEIVNLISEAWISDGFNIIKKSINRMVERFEEYAIGKKNPTLCAQQRENYKKLKLVNDILNL